jgi:hypothetical protein
MQLTRALSSLSDIRQFPRRWRMMLIRNSFTAQPNVQYDLVARRIFLALAMMRPQSELVKEGNR